MAHAWYVWCVAWYDRNVHLTLHTRQSYRGQLLTVGRWLQQHHPAVTTPEAWDEDLALRYTSSVCTERVGEYVSPKEQSKLRAAGTLGAPLKPYSISAKLKAMTRFFVDLRNVPHAVDGQPARRITLRFKPREAFATPRAISKLLGPNPRDIDQE